MSSLMQFHGDIRQNPKTRRGEVGLEFVRYVMDLDKSIADSYLDPKVPCTICGKEHWQVGVAWRVPCGMMGCWVVFRYLGEEQVPDLSCPIDVPEWPRGTKIFDQEENSKYWHREES